MSDVPTYTPAQVRGFAIVLEGIPEERLTGWHGDGCWLRDLQCAHAVIARLAATALSGAARGDAAPVDRDEDLPTHHDVRGILKPAPSHGPAPTAILEKENAGASSASTPLETPDVEGEVERIMQMATAFASAFSSNYGSDEDEANVRYYRNALREAISALLAAARRAVPPSEAENESDGAAQASSSLETPALRDILHGADRALEWAAKYPLGGGMDRVAAERIYELLSPHERLLRDADGDATPTGRASSSCDCPDHGAPSECTARCPCACNADFVKVDRWECRVGCGLPLKESEIAGHECMTAMRALANQYGHLADGNTESAETTAALGNLELHHKLTAERVRDERTKSAGLRSDGGGSDV